MKYEQVEAPKIIKPSELLVKVHAAAAHIYSESEGAFMLDCDS